MAADGSICIPHTSSHLSTTRPSHPSQPLTCMTATLNSAHWCQALAQLLACSVAELSEARTSTMVAGWSRCYREGQQGVTARRGRVSRGTRNVIYIHVTSVTSLTLCSTAF